ncbi:MAG: hypothetical protein J6A88_10230 [Oscillospiraceae bacterium]|nr:hypothetical protein [Oscillospiraceae bacterium]
MKRLITLVMATFMLFSMSACRAEDNPDSTQGSVSLQNPSDVPPTSQPQTTPAATEENTATEIPCDHFWSEATCQRPETCVSCGATQGEPRAHVWLNVDCHLEECSLCETTRYVEDGHIWKWYSCTTMECYQCGQIKTVEGSHAWKEATCTSPRECQWCYATEGAPLGHSWSEATCTSPRRCYTCGATQGSAKGHSYVSGTCQSCGAKDSNYMPTIRPGEKWVVDGLFELSFGDAIETRMKDGKQTVQVTWTYKNIGYDGTIKIGTPQFSAYDATMKACRWTTMYVDWYNDWGIDCVMGASADCATGCEMDAFGTLLQIYVNIGQYKARFVVNIIPRNYARIVVVNSLPTTVKYFYKGTNQPSLYTACSITNVAYTIGSVYSTVRLSGVKTYDSRGGEYGAICKIGWRLYDQNGNLLKTGDVSTPALTVGDSFTDVQVQLHTTLKDGETYRLEFWSVYASK